MPKLISRDEAIEMLSDKTLERFKEDFIIGDYTVMYSFINGESKSFNLFTDEQLNDSLNEEFNFEYQIQ